jgi:hypothetical protein
MTLSPEEIEKRYQLLPCISLSWIKRLKALGVTVDALCEPDFPASGHVVFFDGSRFEFVADAHGGEAFEAMLLLALDEFGEVCDIVAYDPRRKLNASWLGNAPLLGLEQVWLPRLDPQGALTVFADPVEWLLGTASASLSCTPHGRHRSSATRSPCRSAHPALAGTSVH